MPVEGEPASTSRGGFPALALVILLGAVAGLVYTYPLVRYLTTAIPYTYGVSSSTVVQGLVPGDHLQFYYFLSLTEDMASGRIAPFTDPYEFSAPRPSQKRSFFFIPFSLLFLLLSPLGDATAYNLLAWLSFPATALSVFLLAGRFGLRRGPAAVAVAALTVFPNRVANLAGGHPSGFVLFLLPLAFYFLERAWEERSRGAAAAAGLTVVTISVNEPHFVYFLSGLMPLWLISRFWRESKVRPSNLPAALGVLAVAAAGPAIALGAHAQRYGSKDWSWAGLPAVFAVVWLTLGAVWRLTGEIRARAGAPAWLREAASFLPLLGLGAYALQLAFNARHLGGAIVALIAVGMLIVKARLWRSCRLLWSQERTLRDTLAALWPLALALLVTASIVLYFKRSSIDLSAAVLSSPTHEAVIFSPNPKDFLRRSNVVLTSQIYAGALLVPLALCGLATPAGRALAAVAVLFAGFTLGYGAPRWLPLFPIAYHVLPFFHLIRQPAKFFAVTMVALSLTAGLGIQWLTQHLAKQWRLALVGVVLLGILVDFSSTLPLGLSHLPTDNRAYAAIKERGQSSNLLELPIWPGDSAFSSIYQYWTTRTKVPMVNGYNPSESQDYVERVYRPLDSMNVGELSEAQHRLLGDLGVRLITLHGDAYPPGVSPFFYRFALARMRRDPNLREVAEDGGVYLFELQGGDYRHWDSRISWPIGVFYEATSLKIGAGKIVEDPSASGGAFVRGRGGAVRDVPVIYGPYHSFPVGSYQVHFRVRGRGTVEAAAERGTKILASTDLDSVAFEEVTLNLQIDRDWTLEFRGWANPDQDLDVDWVLVERIDGLASYGAQRFEGEDLTALSGLERESKDASGGAYAAMMLYVLPGTVVRDGPYRLFGPGRMRCRVRSRGGLFLLRAERPDGRNPFGVLRVPGHPSWKTDEFDFDLPERTPLCTRLVFAGDAADVDFIELEPQSQ